MPLFMNHCDATGTFQLFVLQGSDCLDILSVCCHKHPALTLKKGTATAENKDGLSLLDIGGRRALQWAGDEGRRRSHGCLSCWEFSNPLTQFIDDSLEKQPHSSPTLPLKDVFHWGI